MDSLWDVEALLEDSEPVAEVSEAGVVIVEVSLDDELDSELDSDVDSELLVDALDDSDGSAQPLDHHACPSAVQL